MIKRKVLSALLAFTMLASGCYTIEAGTESTAPAAESSSSETEISYESSEPETSETKPSEPIKFNPHVHTDLASELVTEDMWNAFFNCCDAIRAGEDSFECPSKEAYEWSTAESTFGLLFPAACTKVTGDGFNNGTAKLKYKMDKNEYLERQKAFETEIERILNEAIRSDYSDLEKALGLYDYMSKHWVYDYRDITSNLDDFGNYACLMNKNGICSEIGYAYSYLLLQAGVEAMPFETSGDHLWTYVVIGGKGYHIDVTWALHGDVPDAKTMLDYFLMTEQDRIDDGLDKDHFAAPMIWPWKEEYDISRFTATDDTFKPIRNCAIFYGMDTEKNVIKFFAAKGEVEELSYGDL